LPYAGIAIPKNHAKAFFMALEIVHYEDVEAFYAAVSPYLLRDEASHNLTFGILGTIRHDPTRYPDPYFALVQNSGEIQLVLLRTPPNRAILSLAQSPQAVTALAEKLYADGIILPGVTGPSAESLRFAEAWSRLSGVGYRLNVPMRTFKLQRVNPVTNVSGYLRRATDADRDLLVEWLLAFETEALPNNEPQRDEAERAVDFRLRSSVAGFYVWDDGRAVCFLGYGGPTPHGIRIGPVYTPPELRGRGYASACVAGASQKLLDAGYQFCFLFTDLENPTSNHIYQAIGYEGVCDFAEYAFMPPG